jgi:hypothetical protein
MIAINNSTQCKAKNTREYIELNAKAIATEEVDKKIKPTVALRSLLALVFIMKMARETIVIKAKAESISCMGVPSLLASHFSHFPIIPLFSEKVIKKIHASVGDILHTFTTRDGTISDSFCGYCLNLSEHEATSDSFCGG